MVPERELCRVTGKLQSRWEVEPGNSVQHYIIDAYNYLLLPGNAVKFLGTDYIKLNVNILIFILRYLHQTLSVFLLNVSVCAFAFLFYVIVAKY